MFLMAKKLTFKQYQPNQAFLLPPSLSDLITPNHPVLTVGKIIDELDLTPLLSTYKGGGNSSYHPRMLLKVLVYGYVTNIYSSRKLEAACRENIHFMYLAGMNTPDHHTINRFRSERLKEVIKEVFSQVVLMLAEAGHLSLREVFTDGTKIEANANRYTFVWAKAIKTNRDKIIAQLKELWAYSQRVASDEMQDPSPTDFDPIDGKAVEHTIEKINKALKDKPGLPKQVKAKLNYAKRNYPGAIDKYNAQFKLLGGRNSYSKTDPDATFMGMKEDHMRNSQLKAAYNLQASTSNQYIVNFSIHFNPADTLTLSTHIDHYKALYHQAPLVVVADAGYGSEQNLQYLESEGIEAYVKHTFFDKDQQLKAQHQPGKTGKKKIDKRPFTIDKLFYNKEGDFYICPMGQKMQKIWEGTAKTSAGYSRLLSKYQAKRCEGCPLMGVCHNSNKARIIEVSHQGRRLKEAAVERLLSEQGIAYRKRRCHDVEPVFGNLKHNHGFRRFMLRGKEKVEIETGLHAIAHNLRKKTRQNTRLAA